MPVLEKRRREDPRREQTEAAFLSAASELLADGHPFAELTVSRLAERARRPRTAFYAHFEDRRALLMRLIEPIRADAQAAVAPFTSGEGDVRDAVTQLLAVMRAHQQVLNAVIEAAAYDRAVGQLWNGLIEQFAQANQARLELAGVPSAHAGPTARVLTWMTERACTQHLRQDPPTLGDAELIDALADTWDRALAPPVSPGRPRA
jgi:AcrR family transcriptional regulator